MKYSEVEPLSVIFQTKFVLQFKINDKILIFQDT
jgi:hypothetical protein